MIEYAPDSLPTRKILVTSALPYANGSIHLGHMLEHIQTDIWVRFQKMRGHDCHYVCADDAHGTPIMLSAQKSGISPQALIDQVHKEHTADFQGFLVNHDNYYTTHSKENKAFSEKIYQRLQKAGYIKSKVIKQAYDADKGMFLPDRFVKGECPSCKSPDQYGDNCDQCGATYDPTELINPYSVLSGTTPIEKDSEQFFFDLPQFESFLSDWLSEEHVQPEIENKIREWFQEGLHPWDISRNAPYWGFEIPGQKDKYFYVWMDAPIGYMASFKNYCQEKNLNFSDYWSADSDSELHHFIGKDIARFHTLFWPAMLKGANYRTPTAVYCHGFLTVNGEKMSKSRGTFIQAKTYLEHLQPEYLRYYFASRLSNKIEDMDMNIDEFRQKVNADLVGKVVNIASRSAGFIRKHFDNRLATNLDNPIIFGDSLAVAADVAEYYENRQYSNAMRDIMQLADEVNQYIDAEKPWVMIKDATQRDKVHAVCTTAINMFKQLMLMLSPVLPEVAENSQIFLKMDSWEWRDLSELLLDTEIEDFQPLLQRIEEEQMTAMMEATKSLAEKEAAEKAEQEAAFAEISDSIPAPDFIEPTASAAVVETPVEKPVEKNEPQTEADVFAELDSLLEASLDDTLPVSAVSPASQPKAADQSTSAPQAKASYDDLPIPQDIAATLAQASELTANGITSGKDIADTIKQPANNELAESNSKEKLLVVKNSQAPSDDSASLLVKSPDSSDRSAISANDAKTDTEAKAENKKEADVSDNQKESAPAKADASDASASNSAKQTKTETEKQAEDKKEAETSDDQKESAPAKADASDKSASNSEKQAKTGTEKQAEDKKEVGTSDNQKEHAPTKADVNDSSASNSEKEAKTETKTKTEDKKAANVSDNQEKSAASAKAAADNQSTSASEKAAFISIDDFAKVDLRVGTVVEAKAVEEADKLLHLMVDIGEAKPRSIFAGIKKHIAVSDILGMNVIVVSNLKPRKMRFGISEGMVLCASGGGDIFTVSASKEAVPGMPVK